MPHNRPRIPASVEHQLLAEAGYRCAVCGEQLPLKRAHIITWNRSKGHSAENLLCLCANCHSRADAEGWGETTLRQYKQRPWVIRARANLPHEEENREAPVGFDVFLSHNSKDKPAVRELAEALRVRGLKVWLDEWELIPGQPWQEALEAIIQTARSSAVLVGKDGIGPWEDAEMRSCLSEFVERKLPVIPVLLPGAPEIPRLPLFLKRFTWVDLRGGLIEEGIDRLQWGITGKKPGHSNFPTLQLRVDADVQSIPAGSFKETPELGLLIVRLEIVNTGRTLMPQFSQRLMVDKLYPIPGGLGEGVLYRWPDVGLHLGGPLEPGSWSAINVSCPVPASTLAVRTYLEIYIDGVLKWTWHKTFRVGNADRGESIASLTSPEIAVKGTNIGTGSHRVCPYCGNAREGVRLYQCPSCGKIFCADCAGGPGFLTTRCPRCGTGAKIIGSID